MTRPPSRKRSTRAKKTVSADDDGVRAAVAFATRFAAARRQDTGTQLRLALVIEELLTNLARYGYAARAPRGEATLHLAFGGGRITLEMIDDGRPFDPLTAPRPKLHARLRRRRIGGFGLHLVRALAETASYERVDGRNHLTLTLRP